MNNKTIKKKKKEKKLGMKKKNKSYDLQNWPQSKFL
jgi:hypothetical protein